MSKFFINRPIVAMVISIIMVIVGVVAMLSLPTSQFPNIVPPEVLVQATYPGADAKTLEQSVATPIEQQVTGVDHMNYMYSTNANNGAMSLAVDFDIATNPDMDQVLTQLRVNQATPQLPSQVNTAGVTVIKSLASPLMFVMLYSPKGTHDFNFLTNYAYINMADELTRVPGVARVPGARPGSFCRGLDVTLEFDARAWESAGLFLLATVLERFLALHATVNAFVRTSAVLQGRSGLAASFPPRGGARVLL